MSLWTALSENGWWMGAVYLHPDGFWLETPVHTCPPVLYDIQTPCELPFSISLESIKSPGLWQDVSFILSLISQPADVSVCHKIIVSTWTFLLSKFRSHGEKASCSLWEDLKEQVVALLKSGGQINSACTKMTESVGEIQTCFYSMNEAEFIHTAYLWIYCLWIYCEHCFRRLGLCVQTQTNYTKPPSTLVQLFCSAPVNKLCSELLMIQEHLQSDLTHLWTPPHSQLGAEQPDGKTA